MRSNLTYLIIPVTHTNGILNIGSGSITQDQLTNAANSDPSVLRYSHDKSKVLISAIGTLNSCYDGITSYNYSEILKVLEGEDWATPAPDLP